MLGELLPQLSPGALFQCENSLEENDILGLQNPARARGTVVAYPQQDLLQRGLCIIFHDIHPIAATTLMAANAIRGITCLGQRSGARSAELTNEAPRKKRFHFVDCSEMSSAKLRGEVCYIPEKPTIAVLCSVASRGA